jgi:hypothetical protein
VRRAPEPGPIRGDRGLLSVLFVRPFVVLSRDRELRRPQLPSSGSRIVGFSSSCYRVIRVDAMPHSIRVSLWFGDSSMKALTRVCQAGLGLVRWGPRARKLSLDGIPRLAALVGS